MKSSTLEKAPKRYYLDEPKRLLWFVQTVALGFGCFKTLARARHFYRFDRSTERLALNVKENNRAWWKKLQNLTSHICRVEICRVKFIWSSSRNNSRLLSRKTTVEDSWKLQNLRSQICPIETVSSLHALPIGPRLSTCWPNSQLSLKTMTLHHNGWSSEELNTRKGTQALLFRRTKQTHSVACLGRCQMCEFFFIEIPAAFTQRHGAQAALLLQHRQSRSVSVHARFRGYQLVRIIRELPTEPLGSDPLRCLLRWPGAIRWGPLLVAWLRCIHPTIVIVKIPRIRCRVAPAMALFHRNLNDHC